MDSSLFMDLFFFTLPQVEMKTLRATKKNLQMTLEQIEGQSDSLPSLDDSEWLKVNIEASKRAIQEYQQVGFISNKTFWLSSADAPPGFSKACNMCLEG